MHLIGTSTFVYLILDGFDTSFRERCIFTNGRLCTHENRCTVGTAASPILEVPDKMIACSTLSVVVACIEERLAYAGTDDCSHSSDSFDCTQMVEKVADCSSFSCCHCDSLTLLVPFSLSNS